MYFVLVSEGTEDRVVVPARQAAIGNVDVVARLSGNRSDVLRSLGVGESLPSQDGGRVVRAA